MRVLFALLGLAVCLSAQDVPWDLKQPASHPKGGAIKIENALPSGNTLVLTSTNTKVWGKAPKVTEGHKEVLTMELQLSADGKVPAGKEVAVKVAFKVKKKAIAKRNVLSKVPASHRSGKATATLDPAGKLLSGSVKVAAKQPQNQALVAGIMAGVFSLLPAKAVKVGESWAVPMDDLARWLEQSGLAGATVTGKAFLKLDKVSNMSRVKCAKLSLVFCGQLGGTNMERFQAAGGAPLMIRGTGNFWIARTGYLVKSRSKLRIENKVADPAESAAALKVVISTATTGVMKKAALGGGKYKVLFATSKGDFIIEVDPAKAPLGAARFKELIAAKFYDECRFFRVVKGFMVQFGINGTPKVNKKWAKNTIKDDPVKMSNKKGAITFAMRGKDTRTSQVFINLKGNSRLDRMGFSPFGKVIKGMKVVEKLYNKYGDMPSQGGTGPNPGRLEDEGNKYLTRKFPKLDYIKTARIVD